MDDIPLWVLFGSLVLLLVLSGFFSGSETALMALNRYRLRHLAKSGHPGAIRAQRLLERPDRLIGVILLGNNFVNILASSLATIIALRVLGEAGIAIAAGLLTFVILIFSEVAPKTLAALHPERLAFPASYVLGLLLAVLFPLVWLTNVAANAVLKLFDVSARGNNDRALKPEELRTVVLESGGLIPKRHRNMLLSILDLEQIEVQDVMVPRRELVGIDLEQDWESIRGQLGRCQYSKLLVYRERVDNVVGFLHLRELINLLTGIPSPTPTDLEPLLHEPYFVPENTPLNRLLLQFQRQRRQIGLVVDEYGDLLGMITLQDMLEEIVGEFTTDPADMGEKIKPLADGNYLVDASTSLRTINRLLGWQFPVDGPRTLNGLITEHQESIPKSGTKLVVGGHPIEILDVSGRVVKTARVSPRPNPTTGEGTG